MYGMNGEECGGWVGFRATVKYGQQGATGDFRSKFEKLLKIAWNNLKKR